MSEPVYQDILYQQRGAVVTIVINRPEKMNAMRSGTYGEVTDALLRAGWDRQVGAIILTGAGERAFCVGGDMGEKKAERRGYGAVGVPTEHLQSTIRDIPKPVIAKVKGYALGGGNVMATVCDLTIAGESAIFGQVGPKMGSVDPGFGTAYLARIVGEKRAREIWYLNRRYSAKEAYEMGLINKVVPDDQLDEEVDRWAEEIAERSPSAIAIAKRSFNADSENIRGIGHLGFAGVALYYQTEEAKEGGAALRAKRAPKFREARERDLAEKLVAAEDANRK